MPGGDDDSVMLEELANHRQVGEILDLLSESGCNTAVLMRFVSARSEEWASALRLIAAHGLLATGDHGTWDEPLTIPGALRLTERGEAVVHALANRTVRTSARHGDRLAELRSAFGRTVGRGARLRRGGFVPQ